MVISKEDVLDRLKSVKDPEIPVLDIVELGVLRDVRIAGAKATIVITPTYSGCPAMEVIKNEIMNCLSPTGLQIIIETVYSPPWSTDLLSLETKEKLKNYGIAPPDATKLISINDKLKPKCPFCESADTQLTSAFGSTACKSFYFCNSCMQPFEAFKAI